MQIRTKNDEICNKMYYLIYTYYGLNILYLSKTLASFYIIITKIILPNILSLTYFFLKFNKILNNLKFVKLTHIKIINHQINLIIFV